MTRIVEFSIGELLCLLEDGQVILSEHLSLFDDVAEPVYFMEDPLKLTITIGKEGIWEITNGGSVLRATRLLLNDGHLTEEQRLRLKRTRTITQIIYT
jgi:hypothetical protein